ncbi:MAG: hypothetical protein M1821_009803 [Bathelium mastoideum]|nr:MAG: hypothetical protein M1821_009803 [Bathelium mastoideum]
MAMITLSKRKITVLLAGLVLATFFFTTRYPSDLYDHTQTRLRPYLTQPQTGKSSQSISDAQSDGSLGSNSQPQVGPHVDTDRLDSDGINVGKTPQTAKPGQKTQDGKFKWAGVPQRYPVQSMKQLPMVVPDSIPRIQHVFQAETLSMKETRLERLEAVKGNFTHAWGGYKKHAWLSDEVTPLSGSASNPFGGWAATLVDSLDTLWIMGLNDEFDEAVKAIDKIDFTTCSLDEINVFETTIRYLGGFLAAYDLSGGKYPQLLAKAQEMGEMLYVAFDTPNRMPITRWNFKAAADGMRQEAHESMLVAELGSLTLEFTRLSQVTEDPRYYDAIARVMNLFESQQMKTHLPGLFSIGVNAKDQNLMDGTSFTIGGMVDSLYEYLPKQHVLLGGGSQQYRTLYQRSLAAMKAHIFYRPMIPDQTPILFAGQVHTSGSTPKDELKINPEAQHLGCFAAGMVGIGAKIFDSREDLEIAKQLNEGCMWAYDNFPFGVMPEIIHTVQCDDPQDCPFEEEKWLEAVLQKQPSPTIADDRVKAGVLPKGVTKVDDARYILRPEAIESVWILYRLTGDPTLPDRAWNMFNSIVKYTTTNIAHAGLKDCTQLGANGKLQLQDRMESFWTAETLKYFYLIFSEPDVINLDEYVLNTEAHPLRRPDREYRTQLEEVPTKSASIKDIDTVEMPTKEELDKLYKAQGGSPENAFTKDTSTNDVPTKSELDKLYDAKDGSFDSTFAQDVPNKDSPTQAELDKLFDDKGGSTENSFAEDKSDLNEKPKSGLDKQYDENGGVDSTFAKLAPAKDSTKEATLDSVSKEQGTASTAGQIGDDMRL